jgi:Na+-transporting methylmalonyl-CoA/oxaloacetate decarboxylase beta subunit
MFDNFKVLIEPFINFLQVFSLQVLVFSECGLIEHFSETAEEYLLRLMTLLLLI